MKDPHIARGTHPFLKTFGAPSLAWSGAGRAPESLRKKDLALLIYLVLETGRGHSRSFLASLLWGDSSEERARHSLTQALGRIRALAGVDSLAVEGERVEWRGELPCDAILLQGMSAGAAPGDPALGLYTGDFLAQFNPGRGAREFEEWADGRRARYRTMAVQLLDQAGDRAEAEGDWNQALGASERAIEIDPFWERGHRRVMRAWHRLGERNRALRHFERFEGWLAAELGETPDPATTSLAEQLRSVPEIAPREDRTGRPAEAPGSPVTPGGDFRGGPPEPREGSAPSGLPSGEPAVAAGAGALDRVAQRSGARPRPRGTRVRRAAAAVFVVAAAAGLLSSVQGRQGVPAGVAATVRDRACAGVLPVARFEGESHPDKVPIRPGETFLKTWTIRNTGPCAWDSTFRLYYEGSSSLPLSVSQRSIPVHGVVPPGAVYQLAVPMRAPGRPGLYREDWGLRDGEQAYVPVSGSNTVWAKIVVPEPSPPLCTADEAVVKFVSESHPDGTAVSPGEMLVKSWTIRNSGWCSLPADSKLRYVSSSGPKLSGSRLGIDLGRRVEPGELYTFEVPMQAPPEAGEYREDWTLLSPAGDTIRVTRSRTVWILVTVQAGAAGSEP